MSYKNDSTLDKGWGDTLARVINRYTGIESCGGCKKRQEKLNEWFPYERKKK